MDKIVNFATRHNAHLDNIYTVVTFRNILNFIPRNYHCLLGMSCCVYMSSGYTKVKQYTCTYKQKRVYERNNKQQLVEARYAVDWQCVYSESDVNRKGEVFQSMVTSNVNNVCPMKQKRVREDDPSWETTLTAKIRRARNTAHSKGNKARSTFLSAILKKMIAKNKKNHVDKTVNDISNGSGRWWKNLNSLTGNKQIRLPESHHIDGRWYDNSELANKLNEFFASVGGQRAEFTLPDATSDVTPSVSISMHINQDLAPPTPS